MGSLMASIELPDLIESINSDSFTVIDRSRPTKITWENGIRDELVPINGVSFLAVVNNNSLSRLLKNYFSLSFRAERGICFCLALLKTKQIPQPGKKRRASE